MEETEGLEYGITTMATVSEHWKKVRLGLMYSLNRKIALSSIQVCPKCSQVFFRYLRCTKNSFSKKNVTI